MILTKLKGKYVVFATTFTLLSIVLIYFSQSILSIEKKSNLPTAKIQPKELRVAITPVNIPLEPSRVTSAGQYISLKQLGRSLVELNKELQYVGSLAKSWTINKSLNKFKFIIKDAEFFSDGSRIQAEDVACSIQRQMRLNKSIHFDFSTIESIEADLNSVSIELKEANPRFIQQMVHPEFMVLPKETCLSENNKINFNITSGPYFIEKYKDKELVLRRNKFYPEFSAPDTLKISLESYPKMIELLKAGSLDFCLGLGALKAEEQKHLFDNMGVRAERPHIGFTYWLSINEKNKDFKDHKLRKYISAQIRRAFKLPIKADLDWERADRLYLPDGAGRLSATKIENIWQDLMRVKKPSKMPARLRVLVSKNFRWNKQLRLALNSIGPVIEETNYENLKEFDKLTKEKPSYYHLVFINNDFSSVDLFENLKVAFNQTRPLVFQDKYIGEIGRLMKIAETTDVSRANKAYQQIERLLLEEALISPLAHNFMMFYLKNNINIDSWSKLYPEVSFWKVLVQ